MGWLTTTIRPLGPRIVVRMDPPIESVGGIVIPDNLQYQPGASVSGRHAGTSLGDRFGVCVAVGSGHWESGGYRKPDVHQPITIAVGERVIFGMYNGVKIPPPDDDPDGEYWIISTYMVKDDINPEVWGVIEDDARAAKQAAE